MQDLGTLGGIGALPVAINNGGEIVGVSSTVDGEFHAFVWTPSDGMQDLGTLGGDSSEAAGFNALGDVVGSSDTATGETHAFRWTREGGTTTWARSATSVAPRASMHVGRWSGPPPP